MVTAYKEWGTDSQCQKLNSTVELHWR